MSQNLCRFGILSTAAIARKNWQAIKLSGNGVVTAVASRKVDSAQRFIDECSEQVPQLEKPVAFGSYDDLLSSDLVDAVYIPLPTAMRHEWVIKAARAGKHIVAEKPAALNADLVAEMLAVCKENNVQYMDGVMFMHSRRLPLLKKLIHEQKAIGELRRLATQFSFAADDEFLTSNIRVNSDLEPHGCLGDLGWYTARYCLCVMNGEMPIEVRGRTLRELQGKDSPGTTPGEFSAELVFASGVTASFYCSFVTEHQQWFHASGSKGHAQVEGFVLPYRSAEVDVKVANDHFDVNNCQFHMERHVTTHTEREFDAAHETAQEVNLFRNFADIVLSGELAPEWPEWTLKTQKIIDACFQSAKNDGTPVKL